MNCEAQDGEGKARIREGVRGVAARGVSKESDTLLIPPSSQGVL